MKSNEEIEKEKRIKKEKNRLNKIYKNIETKRKDTVKGLIERCAFMRVSLEDLEENLNKYGFTEKFSQGNQDPYDRKRPVAEMYNSMNANYQKAIKQLTDLLPKEDTKAAGSDDGFEDFVNGREDI